jgi:hypothetical protein
MSSNAQLKQEFLADAVQAYLNRIDDTFTDDEQSENKELYMNLRTSPYVLQVIQPRNGEEYLEILLIQNYSNDYAPIEAMMTINSKQAISFKRRGADYLIEHIQDWKGGITTFDLSILSLKPCTEKDAALFFKTFDKIEKTVNTNLSWALK